MLFLSGLSPIISPVFFRFWFFFPVLFFPVIGGGNGILISSDEIRIPFLFLVFLIFFLVCCFSCSTFLLFGLISLCFLIGKIVPFIIAFEFILLPIVVLIFVGKTGERHAALQFFLLYTLVFST